MNKKLMVVIVIGVVFSIVPSFVAAKATKPKNKACYSMTGAGDFSGGLMFLAAKYSGRSVKDVDSRVKYYTLIGEIIDGDTTIAISGSMYYLRREPGLLYGQVTGMRYGQHLGCTIGFYDDGESLALCSSNNGTGDNGTTYTLMEVSCKLYDLDKSN